MGKHRHINNDIEKMNLPMMTFLIKEFIINRKISNFWVGKIGLQPEKNLT
jgi:hypothetical protein